jgi:hypothetical protein
MKLIQIFFLVATLMVMAAKGGKVMFYIPFASKSIKMTFVPLVEEMAM